MGHFEKCGAREFHADGKEHEKIGKHTELLYEMADRKKAAGGNDLPMKKGCERGHSLFRSSIKGICTSV